MTTSKGGLNPNWAEGAYRLKGAVMGPMLAAKRASTGEPHAGATINVHTHEVAQDGDPLVFVGGEKDVAGKPIETEFEGKGQKKPAISALSLMQHMDRIKAITGDRKNANVGLWLSDTQPEKGIQVDASAGFGSKEEAIDAMKDRPAEQGAWSMQDGFIPNPHYNATRDPKSESYRGE